MAIVFPTTLDTLTNPAKTDKVNSPSHADQHANANDAIEALEQKVGVDGSAISTSHDYKLSEVTSTDKAVSKTAIQTLTNKTIDGNDNTLTVLQSQLTGAPTGDIVGTSDVQIITNKTFTSPKIGTAIGDTNGNEIIETPATTDAVNHLQVTNAATGDDVLVAATGDDANINLKIKGKGTGIVKLGNAELKFPNSDGSSGQAIVTDASGNLSFASTLTGTLRFGGTGADGALTVSSGTTTIDLGGKQVFTKNYSSISITGTGKVDFINPNTSGTCIVFKCSGDVTLTSSSAPMIDASKLGPSQRTNGFALFGFSGAGGDGTTVGGSAGTALSPSWTFATLMVSKVVGFALGGGGGRGEGGGGFSNGGRGGSALLIECGGALNFTTANGISVAGENGQNGSTTGLLECEGGGGGGGGTCVILYNSLIASSGTINVSGGVGGTGVGSDASFYGGGGGGSYGGAGGGGGTSNGGAGANGGSYIGLNTEFDTT